MLTINFNNQKNVNRKLMNQHTPYSVTVKI